MSKAAVLVDYELWAAHVNARDFVQAARDKGYPSVLLVPSPGAYDYEPSDERWGDYAEFDVVIRNSSSQAYDKFKLNALATVRDLSNLEPVLALDLWEEDAQMYVDNGVLLSMTGSDF